MCYLLTCTIRIVIIFGLLCFCIDLCSPPVFCLWYLMFIVILVIILEKIALCCKLHNMSLHVTSSLIISEEKNLYHLVCMVQSMKIESDHHGSSCMCTLPTAVCFSCFGLSIHDDGDIFSQINIVKDDWTMTVIILGVKSILSTIEQWQS